MPLLAFEFMFALVLVLLAVLFIRDQRNLLVTIPMIFVVLWGVYANMKPDAVTPAMYCRTVRDRTLISDYAQLNKVCHSAMSVASQACGHRDRIDDRLEIKGYCPIIERN